MVTKRKRDYAEARTVELLEPGARPRSPPRRRPSRARPWQVLPYERQLEHKQEQVDDALRRIGGLEGFELEPIVPAVEQWRYRNKLEYSFGDRRRRRAASAASTRRGRWDRIVDVEDCLLASERGNAAAQRGPRLGRGRERASRLRPPRPAAASCATSSSARAAAPASCRPASSPRPASFREPPVDLHTVESRATLDAAPTSAADRGGSAS